VKKRTKKTEEDEEKGKEEQVLETEQKKEEYPSTFVGPTYDTLLLQVKELQAELDQLRSRDLVKKQPATSAPQEKEIKSFLPFWKL